MVEGTHEVGADEAGAHEVGAHEVGAGEVGADEVGTLHRSSAISFSASSALHKASNTHRDGQVESPVYDDRPRRWSGAEFNSRSGRNLERWK